MPKKSFLALFGAGSLFLLTACGDVTMYEPGVYKGKHDESATEEAVQARTSDLRDRASGQTDR
ncbi:hypothetical protein J2T57_000705 [Natronocella acetinitrilica]|uniref:Lipoprotein n=1 Tax=Natronocella acetinitrilica TaxID=414046 RepID=A0AAE3G0Y5_9GAMM|nr:hypothetical protein [Natronocella acetinitrilica]MCP1673606.1 hypothetical protein [Natronocella acetinitrilica]